MSFKVGDKVFLRKRAIVSDPVFAQVISEVLAVQGDALVLGVHDRTLAAPAKLCLLADNATLLANDIIH